MSMTKLCPNCGGNLRQVGVSCWWECDHCPSKVHHAPWQDRLIDEETQLNERLNKLQAFLDSPPFQALRPRDQRLLIEQSVHMKGYSAVLDRRIKALLESPLEGAPERLAPSPPLGCDRGTIINQNLPGISKRIDHTLPEGTLEVWQNGRRIGRIEGIQA